MKPSLLVPLALIALVAAPTVLAVPIRPGDHPNLDSQYSRTGEFGLLADVARQFPQYDFVWQDPLVGFLSTADPAAWIVWSPLRTPGPDFFALDVDTPCANGRCSLLGSGGGGGGTPVTPPGGGGTPVTPPGGGETPVTPPGGGGGTPATPPGGGGGTPATPPSGGGGATPVTPPAAGSIPEPATGYLMLGAAAGLFVLAAVRRRG